MKRGRWIELSTGGLTLREIRARGGKPTSTSLYARLVSRRLSPVFTYIFLKTRTSPNTVTLLCIASGVVFGLLLSREPGVVNSLLLVLFGQLWHILDCSDGEVARLSGRTSLRGEYIDLIGHYVVDYTFLAGLSYRFVRLQGIDVSSSVALSMLLPALFIYQKIVRQCETLVHAANRRVDEQAGDAGPPQLSVARTLMRLPWSNTGFMILVCLASLCYAVAASFGRRADALYVFLFYFYAATLPVIVAARIGLSLRRVR